MSSFADTISDKHQKEFENLKRSQKKSTGALIGMGLGALAILCFVLVALGPNWSDVTVLEKYRRDLNASGLPWARDLSAQQESLRGWISRHGTGGEAALFNTISELLFASGVDLVRKSHEAGGLSILSQVYVKVLSGILRMSFVIVACWRLWLLVSVWAAIYGLYSLKNYIGTDMLGMTGNGRLFYSGIRAGLHKVTPFGAPDVQVTGLACPKFAQSSAVKSSPLGAVLDKHGVANQTNVALSGIVLEHGGWPAYIAHQDEDSLLEKFFQPAKLPESTSVILDKTLELHRFYLESEGPSHPPFLVAQPTGAPQGKIGYERHAELLQLAMHRVLTPHMRQVVKEITPNEVATLVLAHEAGKILTYAFQGGRWLRRSNYGQLNARAILHSVHHYNDEYDYEQRMTIRRGLIYGQRMGAFAPVHLPIDLSDKSRMLRQWMELLMACPYDLQSVADEVEMLGIVNELHKAWNQRFMEGAMTMDPEVTNGVYATQANLLFMPVTKVLSIVRSITAPQTLTRLEELVAIVNQRQRLKAMSMDFGDQAPPGGAPEKSPLPAYARIFTPFSHQEIKTLAETHDLSPADVKAWSSVRVMLNSFGWLGRRVGEHSVPESSIVFAVLKMPERTSETNDMNLIGKSGMVPFRGTRLEDKWGSFWQSRFTLALSAAMAENREYYDRLMKGLSDPRDDELASINAAMAHI